MSSRYLRLACTVSQFPVKLKPETATTSYANCTFMFQVRKLFSIFRAKYSMYATSWCATIFIQFLKCAQFVWLPFDGFATVVSFHLTSQNVYWKKTTTQIDKRTENVLNARNQRNEKQKHRREIVHATRYGEQNGLCCAHPSVSYVFASYTPIQHYYFQWNCVSTHDCLIFFVNIFHCYTMANGTGRATLISARNSWRFCLFFFFICHFEIDGKTFIYRIEIFLWIVDRW